MGWQQYEVVEGQTLGEDGRRWMGTEDVHERSAACRDDDGFPVDEWLLLLDVLRAIGSHCQRPGTVALVAHELLYEKFERFRSPFVIVALNSLAAIAAPWFPWKRELATMVWLAAQRMDEDPVGRCMPFSYFLLKGQAGMEALKLSLEEYNRLVAAGKTPEAGIIAVHGDKIVGSEWRCR